MYLLNSYRRKEKTKNIIMNKRDNTNAFFLEFFIIVNFVEVHLVKTNKDNYITLS